MRAWNNGGKIINKGNPKKLAQKPVSMTCHPPRISYEAHSVTRSMRLSDTAQYIYTLCKSGPTKANDLA
jgi:hypothetical protein